MDIDRIKKILIVYKRATEKLLNSDFNEGKDQMLEIRSNIRMVIRRIYPDYEKVEEKLIGDCYFHWDEMGMGEKYRNRVFIEDVKKFIVAIDTILNEEEVFGIKDFTPVKEKIETEVQIGSNKIGFWRKKKTK